MSEDNLENGHLEMHGEYLKEVSAFGKEFARKHRKMVERRKQEERFFRWRVYESGKRKVWRCCSYIVRLVGEDWVFLTLLGLVTGTISFFMDLVIAKLNSARWYLFKLLSFSIIAQYFGWICFPLVCICFSAGFAHLVSPSAVGSGIPEIKTILRGVVLKDYLTGRTLLAKVICLCASLGCGMPLGKVGPFIHVACMNAALLGKWVFKLRKTDEKNEPRSLEMLAAACAVGVACTFAAPISGVLFSIEVTTTHFAIRNYWRGFYSSLCGALLFRLFSIFFKTEVTLTALFKTNLRQELAFDTSELVIYSLLGVICGFTGALFVLLHRRFVLGMRNTIWLKTFLQKNRFIFPSLVVLVINSLTFRPGFGQLYAGHLTNQQAINELFSNFTWSEGGAMNLQQQLILDNWRGPGAGAILSLFLFTLMRFWMSVIAICLPVPLGIFIPVFTIGAGIGRLVGELLAYLMPSGMVNITIVPGSYAIVGAAAFSGSVTHTISTVMIVFELTGQMAHILPCLLAVIIANAIATLLQPSLYDSMIAIKKLPYLPNIIHQRTASALRTTVEDFMVRDVKCLTTESTYDEAKILLKDHSFKAFPLVDNNETMLLLGSVPRKQLEKLLLGQLSYEKKKEYCFQKYLEMRGLKPRGSIDRALSERRGSKQVIMKLQEPRLSISVGKPSISDEVAVLPTARKETTSRSIMKREASFRDQRVRFDSSAYDESMTEGWFEFQLKQQINYQNCQIDSVPFQLLEQTTLYKVHSFFTQLNLHHAYVTHMGRLMGIVTLAEVRKAIESHVMPSMRNKGSETKDEKKKRKSKRWWRPVYMQQREEEQEWKEITSCESESVTSVSVTARHPKS